MGEPGGEYQPSEGQRQRVLWLSTIAFTLLFAVWLMFGVLGIPIQKELKLSDYQVATVAATAILSGSILRLNFGIWADHYGGRALMIGLLLFTALPTIWMSQVRGYEELLLCALLFGVAGNSFTVGISWNAAWFPKERQGGALGIFGAGNVGASGTKLLAPLLLAALPAAGLFGAFEADRKWRVIPLIYALLLVLMAGALWLWTPKNDLKPGKGRPLGEMLAPLKHWRAWQFSLYYVVVFGAYVALAATLPRYYVVVYGQPLWLAGLLTALFIFLASLLRPLGGFLSDRYGPRIVLHIVLVVMTLTTLAMALPSGDFVLFRPEGKEPLHIPVSFNNVWSMTALVFVVGVCMGIGKAAVFKYIPDFFPRDVGAVGGLVGMLGALGGFVLPLLFVTLLDWTGLPQTAFLTLFVLTALSLAWFVASSGKTVESCVPTTEHRMPNPGLAD